VGKKQMTTIMVVDDEAHIRELISLYLKDEGYNIVEKANGTEALEFALNDPVDMVIMDIMMPQMDGWELCRKLRELGEMPILMITAKGESTQRIKGFQLGTDDYLIKPFDPVEMVMRVKALLRRYRISTSQYIQLGPIKLDRIKYEIFFEDIGEALTLPLKEFELIYKLASYPGQLFTRDHLIQQVWGVDYEGNERTVDVHINRLRDRFERYSEAFKIVTLRGVGYKLEVYHD
jgi:two-component system OmpR family response regulator